jgi:hypothetical protein
MATYAPINPWDQALNPPVQTQNYFGQLTIYARTVCLVKGAPGGKVDYQPGMVNPDGSDARPVACIKLALTPLAESGAQWDVIRESIVTAPEWRDITLPSIRDLGVQELPTLNGQWAQIELVPTGRKYTNQNGETRDATTIRLVALYPDEATCKAKLAETRGGAPVAQAPAAQPSNGNGATGDKEKETALKFLRPYVVNAVKAGNGDLDVIRLDLASKIGAQKLLAKYFTVDSPEVTELLAAEMSK